MNSSKGSAFLFKEMTGTSWHKRFVAEEFRILLDKYPEKIIICDSSLSRNDYRDKLKIEEYYKKIQEYILDTPSLDTLMPLEIIKNLRNIRRKILGIYGLSLDRSYSEDNSIFKLYEQTDAGLKKKLENTMSKAKKILFIPGKNVFLKDELHLLQRLTKAEIQVSCSDDPLDKLPTERMIEQFHNNNLFTSVTTNSDLHFPLYSEGIKLLEDMQKTGFFIFTTNIWVYLEVFRRMKNFGFFLTNSEWFSRGIFQYSYDQTKDNLHSFYNSGYTHMLTSCKVNKGMALAAVQEYPFPDSINVSGVQYNALSLSDFLKGRTKKTISQSLEDRIGEFTRRNTCFAVTYGFYRIESGHIEKSAHGDRKSVLVSIVSANEKNVRPFPILLNRPAPPETVKMDTPGILVSFNYFFTDNLVKYYNATVSEKEKLKISNFFIDYLSSEQGGKWFETIPLYNKALLGCTKSGLLFAGHYQVQNIDLHLKDIKFHFSEEEINPAGDGTAYGIYLPSSDRERVGKNRDCIVTIQDQIIYHGKGPCRVPPAGAVSVLKKPVHTAEHYVTFKVSWKNLPFRKDELTWLIGGFNLLVGQGKNYYENLSIATKSLAEEGWKSKASMETQETHLDPEIRQPRAVFGRTKDGRLLVAQFSGRTDFSQGARFDETIAIVQSTLSESEELDFLINFDGGASASLIGYNEGRYFNFGLTAPSDTNPAGVPRRLISYFCIEAHKEK